MSISSAGPVLGRELEQYQDGDERVLANAARWRGLEDVKYALDKGNETSR